MSQGYADVWNSYILKARIAEIGDPERAVANTLSMRFPHSDAQSSARTLRFHPFWNAEMSENSWRKFQ
jgi:hypothetical protein